MPTAVTTADEELHWLALRLVPGLGARKSVQVVEQFRGPRAVFRASRSELEAAGVTGSVAQSIASGCSFEDAAAQIDRMKETGTELVSSGDARYPPRLREIYDPPLVLFARGRLELRAALATYLAFGSVQAPLTLYRQQVCLSKNLEVVASVPVRGGEAQARLRATADQAIYPFQWGLFAANGPLILASLDPSAPRAVVDSYDSRPVRTHTRSRMAGAA